MNGRAMWALVATLVIVFVTFAPQLGAPFELQDDHRIIEPAITPHPHGFAGGVQMWIDSLRTDVHEVGRFRPVNQVFDIGLPLILGPDARLWHALSIALALAVALLLFVAAWLLWRSPFAAMIFALVTLLAPDPGPTTTWYRLGPKEAWGMLFLGCAFLAMLKRRDLAAFVFVVLTAYSKEPFLLLVPALFGVRVWLESRDGAITPWTAVKKLRGVAVAYGAVFAAGCAAILFVLRSAGAHSYGGQSLAMTPRSILATLLRDVLRAPSLAVWFLPALLAWVVVRRVNWLAILLFLAWIGPQYLLYGTRGGFWDFYWIPCVVAFAAVNAAGIAMLAERLALERVALVVFALWVVNAMRIDFLAVRNFAVRASVQQAAVRIAASHARSDADLVVLATPAQLGEVAQSFAEFVTFDGGHFRRAQLLDARRAGVTNANDVAVIVHLDQNEPPVLPRFERVYATASQTFLSLKQRGRVSLPFTIAVDVRSAR